MKIITCLNCAKQFPGETEDDVLEHMMPHYMEEHPEVMEEGTEEQQEAWFAEFNKRWAEAEEI
ncbi:MAG TPA: hypothetical protein VGE31_02925 [Candidatus Paceibacterota bacterium]